MQCVLLLRRLLTGEREHPNGERVGAERSGNIPEATGGTVLVVKTVAKGPLGKTAGSGSDNEARWRIGALRKVPGQYAPLERPRVARGIQSHRGVLLAVDRGRQRLSGDDQSRGGGEDARGDYESKECEPLHCAAPSVAVHASGTKRISWLAVSNSLNAPPSRPVSRNAEGPMPNKPSG